MSDEFGKSLSRRVAGFGIAATLAMAATPDDSAFAYQLKTLHTFCSKRNCTDGAGPTSALTMDLAGNLYGVTAGFTNDESTVFELEPNADKSKWAYKRLYTFCVRENCSTIEGNLIVDVSGNLYGTEFAGGIHNDGEVFELKRQPGKNKLALQILYDFG